MDIVVNAFAHVLKRNRKLQKLSQAQLALHCGLDRTYISMLERGLRQPTLLTLFQISRVLKIDPGTLVQQVDNHARRKNRSGQSRLPSGRV